MPPDHAASSRCSAWRIGAAVAGAVPRNAATAVPGAAQTPWPPPASGFSIDLTVYGWLPSTHGEISAGPFSVSGNQNFWDAEALIGAMVLADASYGRWRLLFNNVYGYQRFDLNRPVL